MAYYIRYPHDRSKKVKVVARKPVRAGKLGGFAEGPLKTKSAVTYRLNAMNVPIKRRPSGY